MLVAAPGVQRLQEDVGARGDGLCWQGQSCSPRQVSSEPGPLLAVLFSVIFGLCALSNVSEMQPVTLVIWGEQELQKQLGIQKLRFY